MADPVPLRPLTQKRKGFRSSSKGRREPQQIVAVEKYAHGFADIKTIEGPARAVKLDTEEMR